MSQERAATDRAMIAALRLLIQTDRFETDLRDRLQSKKFSIDDIDAVVAELKSIGFLDDARALRNAIEHRTRTRGLGRLRIIAELERLGADPSEIEATIDDEPISEVDRALEIARPRLERGENTGKVARFLIGRGFAEETVRSVLELAGFGQPSDNQE